MIEFVREPVIGVDVKHGLAKSPKEWNTMTRRTQIVEILMKQDAGTALKRAESKVYAGSDITSNGAAIFRREF